MSGTLDRILKHESDLAEGMRWTNVLAQGLGETSPSGRGTYAYSGDQSGAGGMLIADPIEIPAETAIDIQIKLDPGTPLRAVGRVIRNTGDKKTAVQIVEISQSDRQQLLRDITERQRAALRVAGGV